MPSKRKQPESPVQHFRKLVSPERLDRIEGKLDETNSTISRMAQENSRFELNMRAAVMVQQEQIAEIRATQAESARQIAELARPPQNDKAIANLTKQWEAYLRTIQRQQ